jgi:predicted transcriptional regulator
MSTIVVETRKMAGAFTIRLDDGTLEALDRLAERTERSRSWLVSRAVEDYVALNEWQVAKIDEGIADADRGDFASDKEMARIRRKFTARK